MEVEEEIRAQSEREHQVPPLRVSVRVCSFDEFPPPKKKPLQNRGGRQITGETKLTSGGKKQRGGGERKTGL